MSKDASLAYELRKLRKHRACVTPPRDPKNYKEVKLDGY